MTAPTLPPRHWRSYGADPLPTAAEALAEPFAAFPSWFLRIECDRCGKTVMHNESHAARWRERRLADILGQMRHDGCGGRAARAELITGGEGMSRRPVRKIVVMAGGRLGVAPRLELKPARKRPCHERAGRRSCSRKSVRALQ